MLSFARPLALTDDFDSSVSVGLRLGPRAGSAIAVADDPDLPRVTVNLTCERCPLGADECAERVAPPTVWRRAEERRRQEDALARLREGG